MANRAEIETYPPEDGRAVLLAAFAVEQVAEDQIGWDNTAPMVFQFLAHSDNTAPEIAHAIPMAFMDEGSMSDKISRLVGAFNGSSATTVRATLTRDGYRYLGLGMIHEVFVTRQLPGRAEPERVEARVVFGLLDDGEPFRVVRVLGEEPTAAIGPVLVRNDADIHDVLAALNTALADAYNAPAH